MTQPHHHHRSGSVLYRILIVRQTKVPGKQTCLSSLPYGTYRSSFVPCILLVSDRLVPVALALRLFPSANAVHDKAS